jgi:glycosyltransferase involved in cell wall biosynthesis
MKIRIEVSSLANKSLSGVANYTKLLTESLDNTNNIDIHAAYFNFLNRQPQPQLSLKKPFEKNWFIPLRIYAKLQSYGISLPFDILLPKVDLTIFPNFATWPTFRSECRATVIHDLTYLYYPELVEEKNLAHLRRVVPRSIKQADFIITVSEAVKAELIKEFNLSPEKCVVTSILPSNNYYQINNNEIHKKYTIPTQKFIFFIGTLEPRKDLPTLIEAYRKLPARLKNEYGLVIAGGKGWKIEKSQQSLKDAQDAGENIVNVGFIDHKDTAAFYQRASLLVMPSLYEGFGMPILEAMACECPVIASDIPVLREAAGEAALFAIPGDSDSFSFNIQKLIQDPSLQKELIDKGKLQLANFSWVKNCQTIIEQTNKLLEKTA